MANSTEPSAEKRSTPVAWLKDLGLLAWIVVSLVVAGVGVVVIVFGINAFAEWLTNKAIAIIGLEVIGLALGGLMLLPGAFGLVAVLTGRVPPGTTRIQRVVTVAVTIGLVLFGGMFVTAALAGWY